MLPKSHPELFVSLLSLSLAPPPASVARAWRMMYDSRAHGLSLNRYPPYPSPTTRLPNPRSTTPSP